VTIGPYRVDAINDKAKIILEVCGCYHHAHDCQGGKYREGKVQQDRLARHNQRAAFMRTVMKGWRYLEYYTCEVQFNKYRYNKVSLGSPCSDAWAFGPRHPVTQKQLMDAV
jgi:very-short-patch-repair endonuclease